MVSKELTADIKNDGDVTPAARLVQIASRFDSSIYINQENKKVNAKSIMGMMALGIADGDRITITADGPDAEAAIAELAKYLVVND